MDNTGTFHKNRRIVPEHVGFRFEAGLFKSASMMPIQNLAVMDSLETSHHKRMVAVDKVGFRSEADLFKTVQIIIDFGCHAQH